MTDRTEWDDRIPRPMTITDLYDTQLPDPVNLGASSTPVVAAAPQVPEAPPTPPARRRTAAKVALAATAVVLGTAAGLAVGYVHWAQPQRERISTLEAAVAATSGDADKLTALGDDINKLNDKVSATTHDATTCRNAARAAKSLDDQWRAWAAGVEQLATVTTDAQANKILDHLATQYDKIVRQEGRVDTLLDQCNRRDATTAA